MKVNSAFDPSILKKFVHQEKEKEYLRKKVIKNYLIANDILKDFNNLCDLPIVEDDTTIERKK